MDSELGQRGKLMVVVGLSDHDLIWRDLFSRHRRRKRDVLPRNSWYIATFYSLLHEDRS
jgi:hypothetical protein